MCCDVGGAHLRCNRKRSDRLGGRCGCDRHAWPPRHTPSAIRQRRGGPYPHFEQAGAAYSGSVERKKSAQSSAMGLHRRSACALSGTQSARWGERAQRFRLRELDRRIDLDEFTKQLCEGQRPSCFSCERHSRLDRLPALYPRIVLRGLLIQVKSDRIQWSYEAVRNAILE